MGHAERSLLLGNGNGTLQRYLHGLVAEGVWNHGVFMELPPPSPEEVEAVLESTLASGRSAKSESAPQTTT